jgi:hypothetical protein
MYQWTYETLDRLTDSGKSIIRAIGVGPENLDFFEPKWHSLPSLPFSEPKKSRFSGPTPSNGPCKRCCPHQNHYIPRHINNSYINSYYVKT